jgi:hypothetical protein
VRKALFKKKCAKHFLEKSAQKKFIKILNTISEILVRIYEKHFLGKSAQSTF